MKEKDPEYQPKLVQHQLWDMKCRGCGKVLRFCGPIAALYKAMKDHCPGAREWRNAKRARAVAASEAADNG